MARRLAHFNDPKLEAQIQELIEASNALQVQINNLLDEVGIEPHADTHAIGGIDPVTPISIGAATSSHDHAWADIASGVPATATRWPSWSEVTEKPATATRWPSWSEVTSKPSTFTPSTHSHSWADVTGQPSTATRWPSWSEVTSKPSTFTPSSHNHSSLSGLTQVSTGGGGLKVQTSYGYITVGPANTGWSHFGTDRGAFHFNKTIAVTGDIRHGPSYNIRVPKIWVQSSQPTATAAGDLWIQT